MITLTKGATSESIYVTLTEKLTLQDPIISFIFNNVTTNEEITFDIQLSVDDVSPYPLRYNQIVLNTSVLMGDKEGEQWTYVAIENPSNVILEKGKLTYLDLSGSVFTENNPATNYKVYNG